MTPVIGISCSTLALTEPRGMTRFSLPDFYVHCVTDAGGLPLLLPNIDAGTAAAYLARLDGLLLSGGVDLDPVLYGQEPMPDLGQVDQVRDAFEIALVRGAREQGMPVLAICRGVQVLNVAFGGTLVQHVRGQVEGALKHDQDAVRIEAASHHVDIVPGSKLAELAGSTRVRVNSFHHQAVDRPAEGFDIVARAADGVVEGIEDRAHAFCLGVQWHPERRRADPITKALFRGLVEASAQAARAGEQVQP